MLFFHCFLEIEEGKEEGRERNIHLREKHWLVTYTHPNWGLYMCRLQILHTWTGDHTRNLGVCPDQESNPQHFRYGMALQPTEPYCPGLIQLFFNPLASFPNNICYIIYLLFTLLRIKSP